MRLLVSPGEFVAADGVTDPRVSVTVEDNAGNNARVWLSAETAQNLAAELTAAAAVITPPQPKLRICWGNIVGYLSALALLGILLWIFIDYTNVPR